MTAHHPIENHPTAALFGIVANYPAVFNPPTMHQNENGEYVLSRREYTQLAAAVPASHATGDDGWLSGLFGGSSNDGPGLFEDTEYRHENSHIITDPKVIDYVGDAIDIERPNEYDEAVRIRISGDLVVEGEDINPASVGKDTPAESVATEELSTRSREADAVVIQLDTGDYAAIGDDSTGTIASGAEPHAVINSAFTTLGAGAVVDLEPNTYTLSDYIQSAADYQVLRGYGATIEAGAAYDTTLSQNYLVYGNGHTNFIVEGIEVDGNYPTETGVGGIWFDGTSVACIALNCEVHHTDSDGGAIDAGLTGPTHCIAAFNHCHDIHNREGGIHVTSAFARAIGNTIERDIDDDGGTSNTKTEAGLKAGAEGSVQAFNTIRDFTDSRGIYYQQQVHGTDYNALVKGYGNQVYNCDIGMETSGASLPVHSDGLIARQCPTYGVKPNGGRSIVLSNPFIEGCGIGIFANSFVNYLKVGGGQVLDNTTRGIESQCEVVIDGTEVDGVTDFQGIYIRGTDADGSRVRSTRIRNAAGDDLLVTNDLSDFYADELDAGGTIAINAARPRWESIIGAGPLGGVDLSVTTGQFEGDRAMSNGATANTGDTAYSYWTWDPSANAGAGGWIDDDGNVI